MTTDRPAPARPASLAERPANGPRKQEPAPDVFAQILGAKAPADQPKRADAPKRQDPKRDDAPKADAKDKAADDAAKPAADPANAATDPTAVVTPDAPAQPAEPLQATAEQLAAQLASPLPAPPQQQPAEQAVAPVQAPVNAVPAATQAPTQQPAVTTQPAQPPVAASPATPVAPQSPTESTTAPAVPSAETPVPAAPIKTDDVKLPQAPLTAAPHAQQAAQSGAPAQPNAGDTGQQPSQQKPEQTAAPAPSTAPVADAPKVDAPVEPQPVQGPTPAPAQAATAQQRAVPLYRAPQVAAAVIHLASQHGVTHARINLKPAELGGIEVRLHSTPQGISAHLIADSPEAAKALQHASDDLRRQLESRDVTLLSLDVSTSNGEDGRQAGFGADAGGEGGSSTPSGRYGRTDGEQPTEAPAETTLVLPDGVLVDVLA